MKDCLSKPITDAIKGVALIFMFVHHFFTFPDWYVTGISYPELSAFAAYFRLPLKICVPVFAFLTGYFYFFNQDKTLSYSIRKISDVLISYWAVYIPFLGLSVWLGCFQFDLTTVLYEMFAIKRPIMNFCWYVNFYYCSMLLLPLLSANSAKTPFVDAVVLLLVPNAVSLVLSNTCSNSVIRQLYENIRIWFPCVATGYLVAKYSVFDALERYLENLKKPCKVILYCVMVCAAAMGRYYCDYFTIGSVRLRGEYHILQLTMDILYAPMFIYGLAKILQIVKVKLIHIVLRAFGKQSLLMWFIHCIFFNICKQVTQKILYLPQNPLWVTLFGLILCYSGALVVSFVLKPILRKKNELFKRSTAV